MKSLLQAALPKIPQALPPLVAPHPLPPLVDQGEVASLRAGEDKKPNLAPFSPYPLCNSPRAALRAVARLHGACGRSSLTPFGSSPFPKSGAISATHRGCFQRGGYPPSFGRFNWGGFRRGRNRNLPLLSLFFGIQNPFLLAKEMGFTPAKLSCSGGPKFPPISHTGPPNSFILATK